MSFRTVGLPALRYGRIVHDYARLRLFEFRTFMSHIDVRGTTLMQSGDIVIVVRLMARKPIGKCVAID